MTTAGVTNDNAQPVSAFRGFPRHLLEAVRCPIDSRRFVIGKGGSDESLTEATVRCVGCGAVCEIRDGILRLLPLQSPLSPLTRKEQDARDRGAHRYDAHFSEWSNAIETAALFPDPSLFLDKVVLDLACGTGRMTVRVFGTARSILAADFSEQSLRNLADKITTHADTQLGLVWCDVTQLPLAPSFFDTAICAQLLEHIPSQEQRRVLLEQLATGLKPSGSLLLTAYYYNAMKRILRRPQEGTHENGVFFRRFTYAEIGRDMPPSLSVLEMNALQIDPRLFPQRSLWRGWLARIMEPTFCVRLLGQLVLVRAEKEVAASRPHQLDSF